MAASGYGYKNSLVRADKTASRKKNEILKKNGFNLALQIDKFKHAVKFSTRFVQNWIKVKAKKDDMLDPLMALYLITKRCNFRCSYCYAESNERISKVSPGELNFDETVKLLSIMRKDVENVYFSGGEPLLRKDILDILVACREMKYHVLALTTNGVLLPKVPGIVDYLDFLTISLDTLDEKKNDFLSGVKSGTTKKIIEITKEFAGLQAEKRFTLLINAVITEHNIKDIYGLMDFCFSHNIGLSVIAQMENFKPIQYLKDSTEYRELVDKIIEYNRKGYPILGMPDFNKTMLLFQDHKCFPLLIPTVYPNGDLLFPCEVLNQCRFNLLETGSIKEANKRGFREIGAAINCPGECYLPAFITASCFMQQPFSAIKQAIKLKMGNCYNQETVRDNAKQKAYRERTVEVKR